jgi:hypothetical protein
MHSEGVRVPFASDPPRTLINVVLLFRSWPVNSSTAPWHSLTNISRESTLEFMQAVSGTLKRCWTLQCHFHHDQGLFVPEGPVRIATGYGP